MLRLIIARHGNTFERGQIPTRVGARTDLPLTQTGQSQAKALGRFLARAGWLPDVILAGPLARTRQTAEGIVAALAEEGLRAPAPVVDARLVEIDYGPDEDRAEADVEERLGILRLGWPPAVQLSGEGVEKARAAGRDVLSEWNARGVAPDGWRVDPAGLERMWRGLADEIPAAGGGATWLAVTSNGVARFAASLLPNGAADLPDCGASGLKIALGALCVFESSGGAWRCAEWNKRPAD